MTDGDDRLSSWRTFNKLLISGHFLSRRDRFAHLARSFLHAHGGGVMILITRQPRADLPVLKVDGNLSAEDTEVLLHACEAETGCLVLDLTDLRFADRRGVWMLRELQGRGITLTGLSPYLSLLLGGPDESDRE